MANPLNRKQLAFCNEHVIDFNATQAAIRAGYSKISAGAIAAQHLQKLNIQAKIAEIMAERSKRTEITQDRVLLEIARLAFNDPRRAFDENHKLLPVQLWPDEVAAAISVIKMMEVDNGESVQATLKEVRFWDKGKQIELAARHLGMLNDKLNLSIISPAAELDALKKKAADATTS